MVRALIALAVTLLMCAALAAGPAFAAAPAVSYTAEQAVSQPQSNAGFASVSCWAPRRCMAVGTYLDSTGHLSLTSSRQTNDDWRVYDVPTPPAERGVHLRSVSCTSSTFCIAVGDTNDSFTRGVSFAERWDGRDWTLTVFRHPGAYPSFNTVSCVSSRFCIALGTAYPAGGYAASYAEFWDGSGWTTDTTINDLTDVRGPNAISCVSATFCVVVGAHGGGGGFAAARWDGHAWTDVSTGTRTAFLVFVYTVSCTSESFCLAMANDSPKPITKVFDGTSWTDVASPPVGVPSAVTCTAPDRCLTVGTDASREHSQSASWDGTAWRSVAVPVPTGVRDSLNGVSCAGRSSGCTAVGQVSVRRPGPPYGAFALEWDGTSWQLTSAKGRNGATWGQLNSVSCPSSTVCLAVGRRDIPETESALAQRWDGTAWTRTPIAAVGADPRVNLRSVSCATETFCIAVGVVVRTVAGGVENSALAQRWDGTAWTAVNLRPATGGRRGSLSGVSCPTATECVAVGAKPGGPLILHYDGTGWSQLRNRPVAGTHLSRVSCPRAGYCVAAGDRYDTATNRPLLVGGVWDGTAWTFTDIPVKPVGREDIVATTVACATTTSCLLEAYDVTFDYDIAYRHPLSARWNGAEWSVEVATSPAVNSLACPAVDDCIGTNIEGGVVQFDGTNWTKAPLPDDDDVPSAISCATTASCQVVGHVETYPVPTNRLYSFPFPFAIGLSR